MTAAPIADGVFTWPSDDPRLLGSRCPECGTHDFPAQASCRRCGAEGCTTVELSPTGTLWTWTTQGFLPKHPYAGPETEGDFRPYLVGYVELPGEVRVETRLIGVDVADVRIGMPMRLAIVPFRDDTLMYAFEPA